MIEPLVQSLIIKRFRSIPSESIRLSNPTFFVGRNGSGKSNIIDAFSFLADSMAAPLQSVFDRRGGISAVRNRTSGQSYPPNMGLALTFGAVTPLVAGGRFAFEVRALPNYGFEVVREQCLTRHTDGKKSWFERKSKSFQSNVGVDPALDPAALSLPLVGGDARFSAVFTALSRLRVYSIEPSKLREMQDPDGGTSLRKDGSNAASVLQEIGRHSTEELERLCEILETVVPNTRSVRAKKHGNKLSLEFTQEWSNVDPDDARVAEGKRGADKRTKKLRFEAFNMSDGTLRALGILAAVFQKPAPSLLAIEEPEATVHPGALGSILDLIRAAVRSMQVVVTTHSPEVLDAKWIRPEHIRVVDWGHGATRVVELSSATKAALRDHLMGPGELLRSNALRGEPLFEDVSSSSNPQQPDLFEQLPE